MPKNKIGGKHKHLKKSGGGEKKFDPLSLDDTISYAYVTKAYGNRYFDAIILKEQKCVRFQAQHKRKKFRVVVGGLIRLSLATDFTKEFYVVDDVCGEQEIKSVEKSADYKDSYKRTRQENDMTHQDGDADTVFDVGEILPDVEKPKKPSIAYDDAIELPDSDSEDFDIDDL